MINLIKGDITALAVDAIVNAANSSLMGGGGVDGAIHRAAGPVIQEECRLYVQQYGKLPAGKAMITSAGNLPARYVIHTVGPVWQSGLKGEDQLLASCYINSLHIAIEKQLRSLAFPNISTGVYGYPKDEAAEVAIATVQNFLSSYEVAPEVSFVCYDEENYNLYSRFLKI